MNDIFFISYTVGTKMVTALGIGISSCYIWIFFFNLKSNYKKLKMSAYKLIFSKISLKVKNKNKKLKIQNKF